MSSRSSERFARRPGGARSGGGGARKAHAAKEFRRRNYSEAKARATRRAPGLDGTVRPPPIPRDLRLLDEKKAVKNVRIPKQLVNTAPNRAHYERDSTYCSACRVLENRKVRRAARASRTAAVSRITKRKTKLKGQVKKRIKRYPTLSLDMSLPSLDEPPMLNNPDLEIDSDASSLRSFNSSGHEPTV